ncbi:MAG: hypothetical protein ACOX5R_17445 [bacterium]|jgi:hypothetical protein
MDIRLAEGRKVRLMVEPIERLDDVRDALRRGNLKTAVKYGRSYELLYELHPIAYP